jgi:hypothetical protein
MSSKKNSHGKTAKADKRTHTLFHSARQILDMSGATEVMLREGDVVVSVTRNGVGAPNHHATDCEAVLQELLREVGELMTTGQVLLEALRRQLPFSRVN